MGQDWRVRQIAVLLIGGLSAYGFLALRGEWSEMHRWNRALADASVLLIALSLAIGPLARIWSRAKALLPWRRELGSQGVIFGAVHTVIILVGWVQWDLMRLFGYELHPTLNVYVMLQHGFALGNVLGIVALVYGTVLALTSNSFSQRRLGGAAWKFVQQRAYVLWSLVLLHTAYFLYLHFQDFHRPLPPRNALQIPFILLVAAVAFLQFVAFCQTWRGKQARKAGKRRLMPQQGDTSKPYK